jgi:tetratricopeptide (TPR) repeat protein
VSSLRHARRRGKRRIELAWNKREFRDGMSHHIWQLTRWTCGLILSVMKTALLFGMISTASIVQADCPASPDIADDQAFLFTQAQKAQSEAEARPISQELWRLWAKAPDDQAQALLDRGMAARGSFDFVSANEAFDRLIAYCPNYAEGYNQRAFVSFLRQDYAAALVDLNEAIDRSPYHVAALAGKALTLFGLDRPEEAQQALRKAVGLNPWISERRLLTVPNRVDL